MRARDFEKPSGDGGNVELLCYENQSVVLFNGLAKKSYTPLPISRQPRRSGALLQLLSLTSNERLPITSSVIDEIVATT